MGIIIRKRKFQNVDRLLETRKVFQNEGFYTDHPYGTQKWVEFWDEEKRRSIEGYTVGDLSITGYHYFYLNFAPILRTEKSGDQIANKIEGFPDFWDGDYYYFHSLQRCRKLGKHMIVLKARRKGYSYKNASMFARNWALLKKSKNYAMASDKEYLIGDGFLSKTDSLINFVDENTPFWQHKLVDQTLKKIAGYKQVINGAEVRKGSLNEIHGVSLKDNPGKARGKSGDLGIFEEAGIFPGLKAAWEICKSSYEDGALTTGLMIAFGTGGEEDADFEALSEMFYDPDSYGALAFENIWDEGRSQKDCGFFVPAYQNFVGFMDEDGNSDEEGAKEYMKEQRALKRQAKDPNAEQQYISEFPFSPQEAILNTSKNIFPIAELQEQLNKVNANKLFSQMACGILIKTDEGLKFRPDRTHPPIFEFPLSKKADPTGCICILEAPTRHYVNGKLQAVPDKYIIVHDPYAKDNVKGSTATMSLGAAYVIKLPTPGDSTLPACIVASYVGRPSTQDEYNKNLFNLAEFYNAKIGFENNRGNVITYAKTNKKLARLIPELDILSKRHNRRAQVKTTINYGITTNDVTKSQGEIYLRDWLNETIMKFEDGTEKLRLHTILDPALLDELIKFNREGNFDRVMALLIGMFYIEQVKTNPQISKDQYQEEEEFFNKPLYV